MLAEIDLAIDDMHRVRGHKRRLARMLNERTLLLFSFMQIIGLIKGDSVAESLSINIVNASQNLKRKPALSLDAFIALMLIVAVEEKSNGCGLTRILIDGGCVFLRKYFQNAHPDKWLIVCENIAIHGGSISELEMSKLK